MVIHRRAWTTGLFLCFFSLVTLTGCKKSSSGQMVTVDSSIVILSGADVAPTGAITEAGLKKITAESGKPSITVVISRTHITDAALPQLAKFKNMETLQAPGSQLSDAAVAQLKTAVPSLKNVIK
jgi:hypothetical protein